MLKLAAIAGQGYPIGRAPYLRRLRSRFGGLLRAAALLKRILPQSPGYAATGVLGRALAAIMYGLIVLFMFAYWPLVGLWK